MWTSRQFHKDVFQYFLNKYLIETFIFYTVHIIN